MPSNRNSSGPPKGRRSSSPRSNSAGRSFPKKSTDRPFKKSGDGPAKPFRKSSGPDSGSAPRRGKFSSSKGSSPKSFDRPERAPRSPSSFDKRGDYPKKRSSSSDSTSERPYKRFGDKKESGSGFRRDGKSGFGEKKPFARDNDKKESGSEFRRGSKPSFGDKRSFSGGPRRDKPFDKSDDKKGKPSFGRGEKPAFKKRDSASSDSPRPRKRFNSDSSDQRSEFKRPDKPAFTKRDSESNAERPYKKLAKGTDEKSDRPARPYKKFDKESDEKFDKSQVRFSKSKGTSVPDQQPAQEQSTPGASKIRLNKFISNSGVCSRREADELIKMGLISVNGKTITELGYKVNPDDEVRHESKVLRAEKPVYILMNKPKGFLTTTADPQERNTVMHIIGGLVKERIYPVGRLDRNTTGLLLLTNDGDLAEKLMHPSYNIKKIYKVELDRPLTKADADRIVEGVKLEEGRAMVDELAIISDDRKTVGLEIHIGWNRVVRRIFESLEYSVIKLDRSTYAGLTKKDLGRGEWRFLKKEELVLLKHFK